MKSLFLFGVLSLCSQTLAVEVLRQGGTSYLSLRALSEELSLEGKWSTLSCGWTYTNDDGQSLRLQCGLPKVGLDSGFQNWSKAPFSDAKGFWVPAKDFIPLLDSLSPYHLKWDDKNSSLDIRDKYDLESMQAYDLQNGLSLRLQMNRDLKISAQCSGKNCSLIFPPLALQPKQKNQLPVQGLAPFKWVHEEQQSILQLTSKQKIKSFQLKQKNRLWTLDLNFPKESPPAEQIPAIDPMVSLVSKTPSSTPLLPLGAAGLRDIVIDPGHGGKDAGASGAKSKEKDITLAVALLLRDKLEAQGFRVRLTRSTDTLIELSQRPKMASKWKGDLFLSLHCNAAEGKLRESASGFKAYILRDDGSDEDEALARRENTFLRQNGAQSREELSPVDWIEQEHQLNMYTKESERFAKFLVKSIESQKRIPKLATGAGQAGFMVLVGAFMPAVLFEMGFISHAKDEEMLNSSSGQEALAEKISQAISNYNLDLQKRSREE